MPEKQLVILKGRAGGIDILLDKKSEFIFIKNSLRYKVSVAKDFFAGADTQIAFKGRKLSETEERELLGIILAETSLDVSFVEGDGFVKVKTAPPPAALSETAAPQAQNQITEHTTAFYRQGLRSGQSIRYDGSVVIMGDANPGSEIVAHGNVIVLGSLKGMVHAGAAGDESAYISALVMQPTQVRIAGVITYIPVVKEDKKQVKKPSWAYIQDGQVYIAPLAD
jgi:septum site-determining protein MinC